MNRITPLALAALVALATAARADEVTFNNGDRLTGKVVSVEGGKLKIKSNVAGEVTIDLKDVRTFSTDEPLEIKMKDNQMMRGKIESDPNAPASTQPGVVKADGKDVPLADVKRIGPKSAWTGNVLVNGSLARGNTHATNLGVAGAATLRRDDEFHDDRFSLAGAYNYGDQTVNGTKTTSTDNWFAQVKYDQFFAPKWYGYGLFRYDHDRLADLNYRLSPGAGVGYQWIESAPFNFTTEAGVSYVYEDYINGGNNDRVALRLAYHVDRALNEKVNVFHNLEWLPAFDDPSDYNLNVDAGIRATITGQLFSEFKIVWAQDTTPAPGAQENDVRFLLGVGWNF